MGLNYLVGSTLTKARDLVLSSKVMPLTRYFPRGASWMYDVQRFSGSRNFEVIFDVGANIGQTARGLVQYFPSASIFCFEPVASTFHELDRTFGSHRNVTCLQKALGKSRSVAEMALHADSELNTFVLSGQREGTGEREQVAVDTVDDFCRDNNLSTIGILKLDVQGWEMNAVDGAREMLSKNAVQFIYAEVGFRRQDADMQHFAEFNDAMDRANFMFCGLYEPFRYGDAKQYVYFANALYVNPNYKTIS
jgi:FkbM family methyltransferase